MDHSQVNNKTTEAVACIDIKTYLRSERNLVIFFLLSLLFRDVTASISAAHTILIHTKQWVRIFAPEAPYSVLLLHLLLLLLHELLMKKNLLLLLLRHHLSLKLHLLLLLLLHQCRCICCFQLLLLLLLLLLIHSSGCLILCRESISTRRGCHLLHHKLLSLSSMVIEGPNLRRSLLLLR